MDFISLVSVVRADAGMAGNIVARAEPSCLVLEWMDPHELLPVGERWMAAETISILSAADIGARWDWSRERDREDITSERSREHRLRVVLLPSEPSGPGWRLSANTLGATVLGRANAPPAVYIFYKSVAALLGLHSRSVTDHHVRGRTSRALGRIIAHEVAHAIAPGEPHVRNGLMQASLQPAFLTAKGEVMIDAQWKHVLAQRMSKLCSNR